jgi:hypothetical protein
VIGLHVQAASNARSLEWGRITILFGNFHESAIGIKLR